jgi:DNA-binding NtrC family response regulator
MTQSNADPVELTSFSPEITEELQCAIRSDAKVLISGDDRCGKDAIARLIHRLGRRSEGPFVAIDCSAGDAEGGLFGERGLQEQASRGTAFLDKVGELNEHLQAEFVRLLDIGADVRIIVASNENLYEDVRAGRFRDDLYYRLNVIHIVLTVPSIAPELPSEVHQSLSEGEGPMEKAV